MKLATYQAELLRLSFTEQASPEDFAGFGADSARFFMYRQMIRSRLVGMAKQAFRGTHEVLGDAEFEQVIERCLSEAPPRSPYIREVMADLGPVLARRLGERLAEADSKLPPFVVALVRFEEAKWRIAYREGLAATDEAAELSFEAPPLFNPALTLLPLGYAVHQREGLSCAQRELELFVYRPAHTDGMRWYAAPPLMAAVYRAALAQPTLPLSALVRKAAEHLDRALDVSLLEALASQLTLALSRGVLLGSRRT